MRIGDLVKFKKHVRPAWHPPGEQVYLITREVEDFIGLHEVPSTLISKANFDLVRSINAPR